MVALLIFLMQAGQASGPAFVTLRAELRPYRVEIVFAAETGFVDRIFAGPGSSVKQGDLLARLRSATLELDLAEATGDQRRPLEQRLKRLEIRAPFSGVVLAQFVQTGALAGPGARRHETPLFELGEVDRLRVVVDVPEAPQAGSPVQDNRIRLRASGREFSGTVERVFVRVGVRFAEIAVDNRDGALAPGASVEVFWPVLSNRR